MTAAFSGLDIVVLGELATGGMGRIDLACRAGGNRELLAVKRIRAHLAGDDKAVRMFLDEARILAALTHPNVVRLVGFGVDDEGMFLATELVRGASLEQLQRAVMDAGEDFPHELVAYVGARVATGLAAAHELRGAGGRPLGIVHRDVSPDNVLVGFDGDVKISDFGISTSLFKFSHTTTGALKGKVHFMSPEYVRGDGIDPRSDLFSLGVVLYRLVSRELPFVGAHEGQVLWKVMNAPPEPLPRGGTVDAALAELIERLLAKEPAERAPHGAQEVADELDAWLGRRGITPQEAQRRLSDFARRFGAAQERKIGELLEGREEDGTDEEPTIVTMRALTDPSNDFAEIVSRATRRVARAAAPPPQEAPPKRPPSRRPLAALALVVIAALVGVTVLLRGAGPGVAREAATMPAVSSAPPLPSVPVTPASADPAPEATTAAPPPERKPAVRSSARPVPPRTRPPAIPTRACTPDDWDYPRCLRR